MTDVDAPRDIPLPVNWYLGADGSPVAQFDYVLLVLHSDGSVTWRTAARDD